LPYEQDLGIPHQPSFAALKSSARSCLLCYLLLKGINDTRASLQGQPLGDWCLSVAPGNESFSTVVIIGAYAPGGTYSTSQPLERAQELSKVEFGDDSVLKPWLYGNWYTSDENERLLIALLDLAF
jgi:hypothetical protein